MNWPLFFRSFFSALLKVKVQLVIMLVVIAALTEVYLRLEKPSYKTSWIVLLPGTERASTINIDNMGEARSSGSNAYGSVSISPKNTYKEIALSDAVINRAASEYGISPHSFSKPKITLIDQTPAMKFTLQGESKDELVYRANLYNNSFHAILDTLRNNEIERNYQGVESSLADAKKKLNAARQDVVDYQTQSSIISDDQFLRWMNDAEQLRTERTQAGISLVTLSATLNTALDQLGISANQAKALLVLQANPTVGEVMKKLSEKLAEQTNLKASYAEQNPILGKLNREVDSLTKTIRALLRGTPNLATIGNTTLYGLLSQANATQIKTVNELLAKQAGLIAQKQELDRSRERYQARIKNHTRDAAKLADLQRAHQIAEAIFSSALAKLDTSKLDIYATYPLTQLLTQPGATLKRDRLQAKVMIIAALLIYGLLSIALVLTQMRKTIINQNQSTAERTTKPSSLYMPTAGVPA